MKECAGVIGKLFGHNYETVYEVKANPPSFEEAQKMIGKIIKNTSPLEYFAHANIALTRSVHQREREVQEYNDRVKAIFDGEGRKERKVLYDICTRCGDKIIK